MNESKLIISDKSSFQMSGATDSHINWSSEMLVPLQMEKVQFELSNKLNERSNLILIGVVLVVSIACWGAFYAHTISLRDRINDVKNKNDQLYTEILFRVTDNYNELKEKICYLEYKK